MTSICDVASVIRSKNAGPYELTLDILFKDRRWFDIAVAADLINTRKICDLYHIATADVLSIVQYESANAIKITLRRPVESGGVGETDVYGAQQHAPLLGLKLDDAGA